MSDPLQIGRNQRSRVTKAVSVKQRTSRSFAGAQIYFRKSR
jgi:hypothetical protein